ncbi:MAG: hypothetical protein ACR2JC_04620 [Chloroflexota bacterium]
MKTESTRDESQEGAANLVREAPERPVLMREGNKPFASVVSAEAVAQAAKQI